MYVYIDDCHSFLLQQTCYPTQFKVSLTQLLLFKYTINVFIRLDLKNYVFSSLGRHRFIKYLKVVLPKWNSFKLVMFLSAPDTAVLFNLFWKEFCVAMCIKQQLKQYWIKYGKWHKIWSLFNSIAFTQFIISSWYKIQKFPSLHLVICWGSHIYFYLLSSQFDTLIT